MGKIIFFVCVALAFGVNAATYDASTGYVTLLVGGTNSGDMPITTNAVTTARPQRGSISGATISPSMPARTTTRT